MAEEKLGPSFLVYDTSCELHMILNESEQLKQKEWKMFEIMMHQNEAQRYRRLEDMRQQVSKRIDKETCG